MFSTIIAIVLVVWVVTALCIFTLMPRPGVSGWRDAVEAFAWPAILVVGLYQFFRSEK